MSEATCAALIPNQARPGPWSLARRNVRFVTNVAERFCCIPDQVTSVSQGRRNKVSQNGPTKVRPR
jgi:hypothetical protein